MAVVAILIQPGFQLLDARGQVRHLKLVAAYQLLYLIRQGGGLALVSRHQLLDPRHQRLRSGLINGQDLVP